MKKSFEKAQRRRENGIQYKHDLGQHFLYDEALLQRHGYYHALYSRQFAAEEQSRLLG